MKKFISFVMAAAMVASLVPATAFAKGDVTATAKVIDALEKSKGFSGKISVGSELNASDIPELQLKVTGTDYQLTSGSTPEMDVTVTLDNADWDKANFDTSKNLGVRLDDSTAVDTSNAALVAAKKTLDDAKKAEEEKQKAYDGAATDYKAKVAAADKHDDAVAALASADVKTNLDAALVVYNPTSETGTAVTAVSTASGKVEAAQTAYDEEKVKPDPDAAKLATLKTALDNANAVLAAKQDLLTAAMADTVAKQKAYEDAVAEKEAELVAADATVVAAKDVMDKAKTALDKAKEATADAQTAYDKALAASGAVSNVTFKDIKIVDDELEFTIVGKLHKDDIVYVDLISIMDKTGEGRKATVSVDSKMVKTDDLVYASILGKGLKVSVKKTVDVAEEEIVALNSNGLKIESAVDNFKKDTEISLKLSKGFEFVKKNMGTAEFASVTWVDENEIKLTVTEEGKDEITLKGTEIEAVSAKAGAVATITAKSSNMDSASCEVAKVVDYKVNLTVDEDDDVPVIYSGVNVENYGITDDSDHLSLEVTAEETFAGAWSMRQGFNFNLPEGVYVTDVKVIDTDNFFVTKGSGKDASVSDVKNSDWEKAFFDAYQNGDHKNFEFKKRVFDDVNVDLQKDPATVTFQLELVADPTFEGDVKLTFEGALVDKQEVKIAKFVKPYTVKAEQNDLIIDYRNTEVPTSIVITEAEEGLWAKDEAEFTFAVDKGDMIQFEKDATFEIDKDSDLEIKDTTSKDKGELSFYVKDESDAKATVTIKDMKLFMQRNIPAGAYDLKIKSTLAKAYEAQLLFAADDINTDKDLANEIKRLEDAVGKDFTRPAVKDIKEDSYVTDVCDYSEVVRAAFVNVVTSGRDQDNLFTTKVVVPVGEKYLVAGENKVELDVAAYISDAGYTMLPVRAISKALGVNTNNVLWNAEARTVTIMYGQRIITMTVGQKTIYVNGSAIPASAAPEIRDGRTFLPLRDLGTALGVTDVTWDAATKTATLNGGTK
ncbi:stalk domain-containing protein [Anaerotignum sp.]|uniref:stalk domain-containing protein n=1 Tax=Anaerotignum sp. TaxID=2039241 RepID=UPI00331E46D9